MRQIFHFKNLVKDIKINEFPLNVFKRILFDMYLIESRRMNKRCKIILLEVNEQIKGDFVFIGWRKIGEYKRIYCQRKKSSSFIAFQKITEGKNENNKKF